MKEVVSIGDPKKFISNSDEHTHEAYFICKAWIVEVLQQNVGLSFLALAAAGSLTNLTLPNIMISYVTLYSRYCIELLVDDGNDNATFVLFDREVLRLTKQDAAGLTLDEMNGGHGNELPQCLQELDGKDFVFQIRVTLFNFTPCYCTFTVSAIVDHINPETFNTNEEQYVQV
ncbi:unnamed protein product [Brassica oleracea var. botrytis]